MIQQMRQKQAADHVRDTHGQALHQLSQKVKIPGYVLKAKLASEDDLYDLPDGAFIDPVNQRLPTHTRADAWMSVQFVRQLEAADINNPLIREAVQAAEHLWKLAEEDEDEQDEDEDEQDEDEQDEDEDEDEDEGEDEEALPCMAAPVETAPEPSDDPEHIRLVFRDGETELLSLDIYGKADLEKVASGLMDYPHRYPYGVRRDAACQIEKAASDRGWELPLRLDTLLQKTAGMGVGSKEDALGVIRDREIVARLRRPDIHAQMVELRELVDKSASELLAPDLLEKVAGMVDAVDRLTHSHGKVTPPERDLFHTTLRDMQDFKEAAARIRGGRYMDKKTLLCDEVRSFVRDDLGVACGGDDEYLHKLASGITINQSNRIQEFVRAMQNR